MTMKKTEESNLMKAVKKDLKRFGFFFKKITVSVKEIVDDSMHLVNADCQREFCTKHASEFILEIIYNTIGAITVNEKDNTWRVIDGQQRTTSIKNFISNIFPLDLSEFELPISNEVMTSMHGRYFKDLPEDMQNLILNQRIDVTLYDNLSEESESAIYVLMNSSQTALSVIEQIKAKFPSKIWAKLEKLADNKIFELMPDKARYVKLKNILAMFCISMNFAKKAPKRTRFTDCIEALCSRLKENPEEVDILIEGFVAEYTLYQTLLEKLAINGKKKTDDENELPRVSYHAFDDRLLFYAFHKEIVEPNLKSKEQKEKAKVMEKASQYLFSTYKEPFKDFHSYQYLTSQGSDNLSSLDKAYALFQAVEKEV